MHVTMHLVQLIRYERDDNGGRATGHNLQSEPLRELAAATVAPPGRVDAPTRRDFAPLRMRTA